MAKNLAEEADIANPEENPGIEEGKPLFLMFAGAYGDTHAWVWADHLEDAFEVFVEWLDDNAPGLLTELDESDLKNAAKDEGIAWQPHWPDWDDRQFQKVVEAAEADLTVIGHTTLKHGTHIASYEWGGDEIDPGGKDYKTVLGRSMADDGDVIKDAVEALLNTLANDNAAVSLSYPHDDDDYGGETIKTADFGDSFAVDGELLVGKHWYDELNLDPSNTVQTWNEAGRSYGGQVGSRRASIELGRWLKQNGYTESEKGGAWPGGMEAEIDKDMVARHVAKDLDIDQEYVEDVIDREFNGGKKRDQIYWSSGNGYGEIWVKGEPDADSDY